MWIPSKYPPAREEEEEEEEVEKKQNEKITFEWQYYFKRLTGILSRR